MTAEIAELESGWTRSSGGDRGGDRSGGAGAVRAERYGMLRDGEFGHQYHPGR